jgi:hypothetical protein
LPVNCYAFLTEIKAVKKRKERAKDLEGIDMSNIITSSRRRSSSFMPRPVPKIVADSDDDDNEDVADHDENVEGGDKGDDDDAEAGDGSSDGKIQSQYLNLLPYKDLGSRTALQNNHIQLHLKDMNLSGSTRNTFKR